MLLHVPNVLSADQTTAIRQALENSQDWVDGRETVGAQGAQVKHNQQLADASPLRQQLAEKIQQTLMQHPVFFAAALPLRILPPRFNRYRGGGTYGMHIDGAVMRLDSQQHLRSDLSCTLFFNEPDDYDGGELVIADTYGEHEVKLPAGDLILYPASSLHEVRPVTRGERLASFFWIQSMIRDDARRRMLFEMDTSITRLTQTGADSDALLQLTGVYHNLLRQWAET
ncbi:PKHD-type hydroxylase ybiX [Alcanivorax hongdengensis A-11-3]|uniref:PKHD-type hydroxylase ybiX n=1 Tax=Alcanivorax hongdengensis A-11-3 TaxID=1177179 RepID=L0WH93_9GAMM|nr:Fe2+-dependent dioxygenase [Alcanivorax hongdengensis]EKF75492.1 PKHD-type hydroxylase ybiX [Alcanivorax hongdengensis A-11-3]